MPDQVSHYRIDAEIGRGGMGVVYSAHDTRLGRAVAIKMLPPEATADPDRHRRFIQEARAASALNHPHIITIHEIDEDHGTTFIAMELVDGTRLDTLIAAGALPVKKTLEYASQVASALDAAHGSGIVHRDIKPRTRRSAVPERVCAQRQIEQPARLGPVRFHRPQSSRSGTIPAQWRSRESHGPPSCTRGCA